MSRKEKKAAEKAEEAVEQQESMRVDLYEWIQSLMTALVICMAIFIFIIRVIDVSGSSMFPTLHDGDKMLVSNLFYTPHAGDVVRVIATEGQEISIDFDRGIVYIDGLPVEEDYIAELTKTKLDFIGPQTVPEGCMFVMGDNRNASTDSRKKEIGMVDQRMLLGRAYYVIFPLSDTGWIR